MFQRNQEDQKSKHIAQQEPESDEHSLFLLQVKKYKFLLRNLHVSKASHQDSYKYAQSLAEKDFDRVPYEDSHVSWQMLRFDHPELKFLDGDEQYVVGSSGTRELVA
jgi:hypothetical protein